MKQILFYSTFLILLFLSCSPMHVKPPSGLKIYNDPIQTSPSDKKYLFPFDWLGYWSGQLNIYDSTGLTNQINMALEISKTDTIGLYNWTIIYDIDSTIQRREYQLKEINSDIGHYLIDEKNGVFIDSYHIQNELNSIFEVMGNTLIISYALEDDIMVFTVKVFPSKEIRVSGNIVDESNEIPKVSSFQVKSSQIARLYKKCLVE